MKRSLYLFHLCLFLTASLWAGNPDRQGEAGAVQLLLNPWASSAGLHSMNTSFVRGVEAIRVNPAGMARVNKTEFSLGSANYLQGADIQLNALGLTQKVGENSAFGFSLMSVNFGDILVTTTELPDPDPDGPTYNINFFNIGLSYAHVFENKVSVGVTLRGVSESTSDVSSFGFAVDAGVQYVTGDDDNFKFGIALRNVGSRMSFTGQGLATNAQAADGDAYNLTLSQRSAGFELPSMLNIGASYDFLIAEGTHRLTALGNFTANSFSRDQIGVGVEYALKERFMLRGAYKVEVDADVTQESVYTGPSAGASISVPLSKERKSNTLSIDYAYRTTKVWDGTHNFGIRINL
ncbi:MAG: PorV/PorQ family protein [Lewinella sp.]|uniref:PorV/PorQ family protein n=1 Tax=Lewinella sp. TaxID=2004506 RepID=UPI003D6BE7DB